ncbi:hypothetical protein HOS99_gp109 [Staphylococcus phage phiSA_BS1]|uniref:Uncharacterized protein n=2 Tax=Baoshanvirus TaxID=2732969 RepID=A0A2P1MY18_9CAUD|nr:hypothetical protein HOS99_gp109 [Staphylococcus phage phiSA_BS1]YP_009800031.1 hypothetical protein HOT02_gp191 [Staphylococcus phage phiSA_BS2]AVP40463.1 hypothetical protein [Staphylococcus phage phiSA_BS1]AVR55635.1 hypothetical protein phiSABS2_191 [Staphylococcus phage phiSA_BS2]
MKLHLETNIAEGTPEELVEYLRLVEEEKNSGNELFSFGHAHQPDEDTLKSLVGSLVKVSDSYTDSTDIQVGDRVKVLKSEGGAEGEAIVTAVLEDGDVRLEGRSDNGVYSYQWSNQVSNLEKIEAEEDKPMGYTFWYINGTRLRNHNVLKTSLEGYFEDSTGKRYTYQAVSGLIKPIDNENAREKFEEARHSGKLLKYYPEVDDFQISY